MKKLLSILLSLILLLGAIACGSKTAEVTPTEAPTEAPTATPTATPTPEPTPEPTPAPQELWAEFDRDFSAYCLTSHATTFHQLVHDPEALGLDASTVPTIYSDFSEEADKQGYAELHEFYDRLTAIDREGLSEREQFAYDTVKQSLEYDFLTEDYYYYYEPLEAYVGTQVDLPLSLWMYFIEEEADVENYLLLLESMPAYIDQILVHEQKRSEMGLFMTQSALKSVQEDLKDIYNAKNKLFLYETFETSLVELGMTEEEMAPYLERNDAGLKAFMEAYKRLSDGLNELKGTCRASKGTTGAAREYFALQLQIESGGNYSPNKALEVLEEQMNQVFYLYYVASQNVASDKEQLVSVGTTEENLAFLEETMQEILPPLPEYEIDFHQVPDNLADMFSPAAYLHPAVDNWQHNTILMNLQKDDLNVLQTLAHEAYPGHMYQFVYHHSLEDLPLSQVLSESSTYAEAWSQTAEYLLATEAYSLDRFYLIMDHAWSSYITMLQAYVSIQVNYFGHTQDSVANTLERFYISRAAAKQIYEFSVDNPTYYFPYAFGYANIMSMYYEALETIPGEDTDREFYQFYLDLGPSEFHLIRPKFEAWLKEKKTAE